MVSKSYATKNYTEQGGDVTHIGGQLLFEEGGTVGNFPYSPAGASKLGAVKVGAGLNVASDGTLSAAAASAETAGAVKTAANQPASTAEDVAGLKADLNTLLASLKAAGIMAPDAAAE